MKQKRSKLLLIPLILLLSLIAVIATFFIVQDVTTDTRVKAYRNYVKERYDGSFGASVRIDDEEKFFLCECTGPDTIASFDEIRIITDEFLSSDEVGQSLEGYGIFIIVKGTSSGPVFAILSNKGVNKGGDSILEKELVYVSIRGLAGTAFRVSETDGLFRNINYLTLEYVILDDVSVLLQMEKLETVILFNEYTEADFALVRDILPNCEVIDGAEARERGFLPPPW